MQKHVQLTVRDIRGPYSQLLVNLQGKDGRTWLAALNRFLDKKNPWDGKPLFAPWMTVLIGQFSSVEQIERIYAEEGFGIDNFARNILHHKDFRLADKLQEIDLVLATPREMGVPGNGGVAYYSEILQGARLCGLGLCPAEAIIQARRKFEQPYQEHDQAYIHTLMRPFFVEGTEFALELNHNTQISGTNVEEKVTVHMGAYDVNSCIWNVDIPFICVSRTE